MAGPVYYPSASLPCRQPSDMIPQIKRPMCILRASICRTITSEGWAVFPPYTGHTAGAQRDRCPLWQNHFGPKAVWGPNCLPPMPPSTPMSSAHHPHISRHVIHHPTSISSTVSATSLPSRPLYPRYTKKSWRHAGATRPKRAKNSPKSKILSKSR